MNYLCRYFHEGILSASLVVPGSAMYSHRDLMLVMTSFRGIFHIHVGARWEKYLYTLEWQWSRVVLISCFHISTLLQQ